MRERHRLPWDITARDQENFQESQTDSKVVYIRRRILPVLLDLESPVEGQMCNVIVIDEAGSSVVLSANEHAGWSLLGLESLLIDGFLLGIWAVGSLEEHTLVQPHSE